MEGNVMLRSSFSLLIIATLALSAVAVAGDWTGNINAFLGYKYMDEDDWMDEFQEQTEGGILFDIQKKDWSVCAVLESMYSMGDDEINGVDIEVATTEVLLGVGKTWAPNATIRPYVRGGIVFASVEQEMSYGLESESVDGSGTGFGLSGGVYWSISQHFNLGLGVRYTKAELDVEGYDVECGGTHSGLVIGYHW